MHSLSRPSPLKWWRIDGVALSAAKRKVSEQTEEVVKKTAEEHSLELQNSLAKKPRVLLDWSDDE